jgi:type I restriction enzyme, S subunit
MTTTAFRHQDFKRLTEVGSVGRGKSKHRPRNDPQLYGGNYPFMQTGDVKAAPLYLSAYSQTYNEKGLSQSKLWPPGTLCITIAANIADTAILGIPACFPDSIIGFIPTIDKADAKYVKYCLDTYKKQIQSISQGTTQDNLSVDKLLSFRFRIPGVVEQRKIAALLSAYDDLIENNRRRIALLERMAEQLYREWFVRFRFLCRHGSKSEKGIPDGWVYGKLGSIIDSDGVTTGKRPKGGAEGAGVPSIGAENIDGLANYNYAKEKFVSESFFLSMRQGHVRDRDVLFYKDGAEIGRVALFQDEYPHKRCCVNEHVFIVRANDSVYQYLLYFYLRQGRINEHVKLINKNAAQPGINKGELLSIPMLIPPREIVAGFNQMVAPLIRQIFVLAKTERRLSATRDLLLPRLISGKLRVDDLDIQFPPSMQDAAA